MFDEYSQPFHMHACSNLTMERVSCDFRYISVIAPMGSGDLPNIVVTQFRNIEVLLMACSQLPMFATDIQDTVNLLVCD